VPGPGAFDHDHTHPVPPLLDFLCRRHVASPPAGMRSSHGERLFQPIPAGCKGSIKN
jgi:hypothetical protein